MSDAGDPTGGGAGPNSRSEWEALARRLAAEDLARDHGREGDEPLADRVETVAATLRDGGEVAVDDLLRVQLRASEVIDAIRTTGRQLGDLDQDDPRLAVLAATSEVAAGGALVASEARSPGADWSGARLTLDMLRALAAVDRLTENCSGGFGETTPGVAPIEDAIDDLLARDDVDRRTVATMLACRAARLLVDD